ncbi:MAG: ABC transporter substrate-binding protein [bacterium]
MRTLKLLCLIIVAAILSDTHYAPAAAPLRAISASGTAAKEHDPAAEPVKLIYALPVAVPSAVAYLAIEKGFFRDAGLDVEAKMFSSGREALVALLAGQAQIQTVSETPVVHAIIQGNNIMTVATIAVHSEAKLIVRKDHGISKPQDLIGKRVATYPGTNSDYFMYEFFRENKIPLNQVKVTNMEPPEMVVAFVKGDIDAYFAWEPHIYYGRKHLADKSVVFYPGELYRGWSMVNMDPEFVRKNPETVRKIIRAFLKTEEFIAGHPKEAMRLTAKWLKIDEELLKALWKNIVFKVELDRKLPEMMRKQGLWALDLTKSKKPLPDFRKFIYDKALNKEKPSAVRF